MADLQQHLADLIAAIEVVGLHGRHFNVFKSLIDKHKGKTGGLEAVDRFGKRRAVQRHDDRTLRRRKRQIADNLEIKLHVRVGVVKLHLDAARLGHALHGPRDLHRRLPRQIARNHLHLFLMATADGNRTDKQTFAGATFEQPFADQHFAGPSDGHAADRLLAGEAMLRADHVARLKITDADQFAQPSGQRFINRSAVMFFGEQSHDGNLPHRPHVVK